MGDVLDFLFGACLLSSAIFGIVGMPLHNAAKRRFLGELKPKDTALGFMGLRFYSLLLRKHCMTLDKHGTISLLSVYRFCVLGFIVSYSLAVLLLLSFYALIIIF
jgi:hypothetical protein